MKKIIALTSILFFPSFCFAKVGNESIINFTFKSFLDYTQQLTFKSDRENIFVDKIHDIVNDSHTDWISSVKLHMFDNDTSKTYLGYYSSEDCPDNHRNTFTNVCEFSFVSNNGDVSFTLKNIPNSDYKCKFDEKEYMHVIIYKEATT